MTTLDHAKPHRMRRKRAIEIALVVATLVYFAVSFGWAHLGAPPYFVVVALAAIICVLSFLWPAAMDEVEKQTHFKAWFWGGSAGLCVTAAIILALVPMSMDPAGVEDPTQRQVFTAGLAAGLMPPTIGYLIGLGVLWLRRR